MDTLQHEEDENRDVALPAMTLSIERRIRKEDQDTEEEETMNAEDNEADQSDVGSMWDSEGEEDDTKDDENQSGDDAPKEFSQEDEEVRKDILDEQQIFPAGVTMDDFGQVNFMAMQEPETSLECGVTLNHGTAIPSSVANVIQAAEELMLQSESDKGKISKEEEERNDEFKCSNCGKAFRKRHNLIVHERVHYDIRPFKCRYCEAAFRQKAHLNRHLTTHKVKV